eukprot:749189-Rhodomonas_salina.1
MFMCVCVYVWDAKRKILRASSCAASALLSSAFSTRASEEAARQRAKKGMRRGGERREERGERNRGGEGGILTTGSGCSAAFSRSSLSAVFLSSSSVALLPQKIASLSSENNGQQKWQHGQESGGRPHALHDPLDHRIRPDDIIQGSAHLCALSLGLSDLWCSAVFFRTHFC